MSSWLLPGVVGVALMFATPAQATITLPFTTTFNCSAQTWTYASHNCDSLDSTNATCTTGGTSESAIEAAANYSSGGGANGFTVRIGDGTNINSAAPSLQSVGVIDEVYIRWYMKYPVGFAWSTLLYQKLIYFGPYMGGSVDAGDGQDLAGSVLDFEGGDDAVTLVIQQLSTTIRSTANKGWFYSQAGGGTTATGTWHWMELHVKKDTNGANGIAQVWTDGELIMNRSDLNFAGEGFHSMTFFVNQNSPSNGTCMPVSLDDIRVSTTGPIGELGAAGQAVHLRRAIWIAGLAGLLMFLYSALRLRSYILSPRYANDCWNPVCHIT